MIVRGIEMSGFKGTHWSDMPNRNEIILKMSNAKKGKHISTKTEFKKGMIPSHKLEREDRVCPGCNKVFLVKVGSKSNKK